MPVQYHAPAGSGQARSAGGPGWPRQMCSSSPGEICAPSVASNIRSTAAGSMALSVPLIRFRRRSPGQRRRLRQRAGRRRGSCGSPLRSRPRHLGTARPTADHRRALPRQRRLARPAVPGAVGQLCPAPAVDRLFRRVGVNGNRKLHTSGRELSGGADVLPLMPTGRVGLDAGSGATGVLPNTRRDAAGPAVTTRLPHAVRPTLSAASADAPASGSCCPGC